MIRTHSELLAVEHRAHVAVVTDMDRLVRGVNSTTRRSSSTRAALASVDRRLSQVRRRPDTTLWGTFADVMLSGDVLARWHSTREVVEPHTFAVDVGMPSSWSGHRLVDTALGFLRDKQLMSPWQYRAMQDGYRSAGFSIAGIAEQDMLHVARRSLARSLRLRYDVPRAAEALQDALERAGFDRLRPWHAQLVAQMNFASAYGAGSWEMLHDKRLAGIIPAYRYMTMEDAKVRPEHEAMHGFVAARRHPFWTRCWPPNGYNCRCWVVGVSVKTWQKRGERSDAWPMYEFTDYEGVVHERRAQPDRAKDGSSFVGNPSRYLRARAREGRNR